MVFPGSKINITDNSGGKKANCVKIFKCSQRKGLNKMGTLLISIRKIKQNKNKVEKKKMYKAILIRSSKNFIRKNGFSLKFKKNAIILLNDRGSPLASRIKGPLYKEFRSQYYSKVLILSNFSL